MSKLQVHLVEYRNKMKLTQFQLADRLGVKRSALSKWEMGVAIPRADVLKVISQEIGVSVDQLIDNQLPVDKTADDIKFAFYDQHGIVSDEQIKEIENFINYVKSKGM